MDGDLPEAGGDVVPLPPLARDPAERPDPQRRLGDGLRGGAHTVRGHEVLRLPRITIDPPDRRRRQGGAGPHRDRAGDKRSRRARGRVPGAGIRPGDRRSRRCHHVERDGGGKPVPCRGGGRDGRRAHAFDYGRSTVRESRHGGESGH